MAPIKVYFSEGNITNIIQHTNTVIYKLWTISLGMKSSRIDVPQIKTIRLVTNSSYFAQTTPLFLTEGLLKVSEIFKLKLLKFFYKLSYDLLPPSSVVIVMSLIRTLLVYCVGI